MNVRSISAVTLAVNDMERSVEFYGGNIGMELLYGGASASFTSFKVGEGYVNLTLAATESPTRGRDHRPASWGRVIFHVEDVDALYLRLVQAGLSPTTEPADAPWGERYFHIHDPDSHELSFAKPI
ncbi:MAG: VOC family protein [Chloroflexi bacterium]|nr:VOC family protein [Chloroflexota bacterium]MDA1272394.1 VOC family protein [Chloroflexota bacterium]PKB58841.1 MAG: glyoxalase [SAR202 cluster bacterium Casp-Chloro-G2]